MKNVKKHPLNNSYCLISSNNLCLFEYGYYQIIRCKKNLLIKYFYSISVAILITFKTVEESRVASSDSFLFRIKLVYILLQVDCKYKKN